MAKIDGYNYFPSGLGAISESGKLLAMGAAERTRRIYYTHTSHRYRTPLLPRQLSGSTDANRASWEE